MAAAFAISFVILTASICSAVIGAYRLATRVQHDRFAAEYGQGRS